MKDEGEPWPNEYRVAMISIDEEEEEERFRTTTTTTNLVYMKRDTQSWTKFDGGQYCPSSLASRPD